MNSSSQSCEEDEFQYLDKGKSNSDYTPETYCPGLPGFRPSNGSRIPSTKSQSLSFVNGYMVVRPVVSNRNLSIPLTQTTVLNRQIPAPVDTVREVLDPTDVKGRYSFCRKKADREKSNIALPFCPTSKLPSFLEHDRRVLLFKAYYEEDVLQSAIEDKRILICEIYLYVEDGTIEIIQTKQENSGIPHGVFLRRSKIPKPESSRFYEIDDLKIGNAIMIYGRVFHIVSCNGSTKDYVLQKHGWNEHDVEPIPLPKDLFTESNEAKMRRESGVPGVERNRKMNDLKIVMESMLGKETSMTDRGKFLKCGMDALCFHVVWDDTERLYGEIQFFLLFYYLADDTVEIMRAQAKGNEGIDSFPKLLKRSKLPRNGDLSVDGECYTWKELAIGETINVFGRKMLITKCDSFTRQFYASNHIILQEEIPFQISQKKIEVKRIIPPYNGFGTEEDSLRSCTGSLNSPPPKKDLQKMREKNGVILRFNAQIVNDKSDDMNRRFVVQFFMEDDTIAIREPPVRNSGVMGGNFLRRQPIKRTNGDFYAAKDIFVGNILDILGHRFLLLNADEYSYKLMECDNRTFLYSDLQRIKEHLLPKKDEIKLYLLTNCDSNGMLDMERLSDCCDHVELNLNKQEIITLWRKLDKKGNGKVALRKLLKLLTDDTFTLTGENANGLG